MQLDLFKEETEAENDNENVYHKACSICGEVHPETEEFFYKLTKIIVYGEERQKYDSRCIPCHRITTRTVQQLKKRYGHRAYGNCDCCGKHYTESRSDGPLSLDHDHKTGEYRGHLCRECNTGIGQLGDNITGVLKAVEYLKKNNEED